MTNETAQNLSNQMLLAATQTDLGAQPGPEDESFLPNGIELEATGGKKSDVYWPKNDINSPDYSYLASIPEAIEFDLTADHLDAYMSLNRYHPDLSTGVLAFALRGAQLIEGHQAEKVTKVALQNVRPNHRDFRCVIGLYYVKERYFTVLTGSTVPCQAAVWGYANGLDRSNLLPTGLHTMHVWRHKKLQPALRMSKSATDLEAGAAATVLRNTNDLAFGRTDDFDYSKPYDNVHCSYFTEFQKKYGAYFSSWGCLTVRGEKTPTDQWAIFQTELKKIGAAKRVDLLIATGKDLSLVAAGKYEASLQALRRGSKGDLVRRLQEKLGLPHSFLDGDFGPKTLEVFTDFQSDFHLGLGEGPIADGVYSSEFDMKTGWGILNPTTENAFSDAQEDLTDVVLRGTSVDDIEEDSESIVPFSAPSVTWETTSDPVQYSVKPTGEPQAKGTKYYVLDQASGETYYAGKVFKYGSRRGLSRSSTLLTYDRHEAEAVIGQWAHFMWPTVMAESNGRYISINAWDRAHFTWGFYQLAAHTARDNLILLMRELIALPSAAKYFPDLVLKDGKVARITSSGVIDLEREEKVKVGRGYETQIPEFMMYLNPSSRRVDEKEVLTAAKFAAWAIEDSEMRDATVRVSIDIMKRKVKYRARKLGLVGKRPELALWVSDMFHQGRGDMTQVRNALRLDDFEQQLEALSKIDTTGNHGPRLKSVKKYVGKLMAEKRFDDIRLGDQSLPL